MNQHGTVRGEKNGINYPIKQNTCRNCGAIGHLYKSCKKPIMSFGLICYRQNEINHETEYLLIQRRDSLSFMEFIRGKYDLDNIVYIKNLMSFMTETERNSLVTMSFDDLWNQVWYQPFVPKQTTQEYHEAKEKFTRLKQGFLKREVTTFYTLGSLLLETSTKYQEPEWGFPKGRRRLREKDVECAVREFCEETGFTKHDIELEEHKEPYEEVFYGTNNVLYRHVYYIAKVVKNIYREIVIDQSNPHQAREVRQVQWFPANEVLERIREHNVERKELFKSAVQKISEY